MKHSQKGERHILHNRLPLYDENVTFLRVRISARFALAHDFVVLIIFVVASEEVKVNISTSVVVS